MNYKTLIKLRILITIFVAINIGVAVAINNFYLAMMGILIGVLFMFLVKTRYKKITVDERTLSISGKASRITYTLVTVALAFSGLYLIIAGRQFDGLYGESIGTLFTYISMLMIAIYSISYYYLNKEHGRDK